MAYEKAVHAQLAGVTDVSAFTQRESWPTLATGYSSMRIPLVGHTSTTGGWSAGYAAPNPFAGTLFWDSMSYYLTGVSVGTGSSFTVLVETDAIDGFTGLPIAGISLSISSTGCIPVPNLHRAKGSPTPTHLRIVRTKGADGIWFKLWATGKAMRGTLSSPGGAGKGGDRVLQGKIWDQSRNIALPKSDADATFAMSVAGASASYQGLNKMRLWDQAMFWAVTKTPVTGSWNAHIFGTVDGATFVIAEGAINLPEGASHNISYPNAVLPLASNFGGVCPVPTAFVWTEVDAAVAAGCSMGSVVMIAKSNRGTYR